MCVFVVLVVGQGRDAWGIVRRSSGIEGDRCGFLGVLFGGFGVPQGGTHAVPPWGSPMAPPGGPPWGFPRGSPGTLIDFKHSSLSGGIIWFEPSFLDRINLFEPSFLGRRNQFDSTSE